MNNLYQNQIPCKDLISKLFLRKLSRHAFPFYVKKILWENYTLLCVGVAAAAQ